MIDAEFLPTIPQGNFHLQIHSRNMYIHPDRKDDTDGSSEFAPRLFINQNYILNWRVIIGGI